MSETRRRIRGMALFAAALAGAGARADDAVWNKTVGGSYDWTNAVNWLPATTYPNGAGQAAWLTNDITGTPSVQLRQDITLGRLTASDAVASGSNYGPIFNNKAGESFSLTFDSGAVGVPAAVAVGSSGTPTIKLEAPMILSSDLLASVGGYDSNNHPTLAFNAPLAMNGRTITFTNGLAGQNQFLFDTGAVLTGDGTLVNNAQTVVSVNGSKAFAGRLVANRGVGGSNTGSFTLTGGGFTNAAEVVINGALTNGNVQLGGVIHSGHNSGLPANPGQRWTRRQVTLNGGSLDDGGQAAGNFGPTPTNDWQRGLEYVRDDLGTLALNSGTSYIFVNASSTTTGTILSAAAVVRRRGAAAFVSGPNTTNKQFLAGNGASLLRGAGGASGSQTMGVIPWFAQHRPGDGTANPGTFSTWVAGGGIRGLADAEYASSISAGADYNVSVSSVSLSSDATVNALRAVYLNASPANNIGTNRTLTVASGGLFFQVGGKFLGVSGSPNAGTLNFGPAEGVIWVLSTTSNMIGARITGGGGLTKAGTGSLFLTGANAYSGDTHVGCGTLRVGDGTYGSRLGEGGVTVHAGALLQVSCADALDDDATLSVLRAGVCTGCVRLDADVNESVRFLYLGGEAQRAGTYGSSASAAVNKSDLFFAGSGVLTVTGDATALGRGTLIRLQ